MLLKGISEFEFQRLFRYVTQISSCPCAPCTFPLLSSRKLGILREAFPPKESSECTNTLQHASSEGICSQHCKLLRIFEFRKELKSRAASWKAFVTFKPNSNFVILRLDSCLHSGRVHSGSQFVGRKQANFCNQFLKMFFVIFCSFKEMVEKQADESLENQATCCWP